VADTAVHPMQDVLRLPGADRMNFPGKPSGYWEWRFSWDQVKPAHAQELALLTRLYGRDGVVAV
jgi:4-alpha-glucanotransferase